MGFYDVGLTYNPKHVTGTMSESDLFETVSGKFPNDQLNRAVQTALCESSGNVTAQNTDHYGIFQIEGVNVRCVSCLDDPVYNANVAARMYAARGWEPWQCGTAGYPLPKLSHPNGPSNEADNPPENIPGDIAGGASSAAGAVSHAVNSIGDFFGNINLTDLLKILLGGFFVLGAVLYFVDVFTKNNPLPPIPIPE